MNDYHPVSHQNPTYDPQYNKNMLSNLYNLHHEGYNQYQMHNRALAQQNAGYEGAENPQLMGESRLQHLNNEVNALEKDISDNNKEIRLLNNKITKSDLQHAQLKKLYEKQTKLKQKQFELQEILRNQEYLREEMIKNKMKESQIKHTLGQEYQQIVQERKKQEKQQKTRQKQQQAAMINYNQQAMYYERERKRQFVEEQKRAAQQELRQREYLREVQKQEQQKQKQQYNQVLSYRKQLQTQKDHVYRQYYNHFAEEQQKLQTIYKNRALQSEKQKQQQRIQQQQKQYETFQMRMARQNQQKLRKLTEERESLRNFLQAQMEENQKRKARQKSDQLIYQNQVRSYQGNLKSYDLIQKQKKRELQRRYDNELSTQIQFKNRIDHLNTEQPYRSSSMGRAPGYDQQTVQRKTHNPVTNPIDFKIGITNPYVIKEYEDTKEKYMGDHNLKLRNLAMIGNQSLMNAHH